ncbi:putative pectinesterase 14 [Impatiens glandulifera]|uniref:putative pectinesterase 14 n=1 Tax=Impatiens glandulifera TaxID=253017 RepID=UPI001FB0E106|nr:putative pectinesterase 14 [Impatiens glandulifera]
MTILESLSSTPSISRIFDGDAGVPGPNSGRGVGCGGQCGFLARGSPPVPRFGEHFRIIGCCASHPGWEVRKPLCGQVERLSEFVFLQEKEMASHCGDNEISSHRCISEEVDYVRKEYGSGFFEKRLCVQFFLGQYSRIVYAHTYFDNIVAHGGWDDWDHISNKNKTAFFGVYKCYGPGAKAVRGVSLARELDYELAHPFLAKSFVNGKHWIAHLDA